jgi:hypothetical protein
MGQIIEFSSKLQIVITLLFICKFELYLDKTTHITKPTCWIILILLWPLIDFHGQTIEIYLNCHNFVIYFMDLGYSWTKEHLHYKIDNDD